MYSANWKEAVKLHTGVSLSHSWPPGITREGGSCFHQRAPLQSFSPELCSRSVDGDALQDLHPPVTLMACRCRCTLEPPICVCDTWTWCAPSPACSWPCGWGCVLGPLSPEQHSWPVDVDLLWGLQHSHSPPGFGVLPGGRGRTEEGKAR